MKKLTNHVFSKNKREIAVLYYTEKELKRKKVHEHDAICLAFDAQDGEKAYKTYMRPDEALLVSWLLTEAVYKATKAYELDGGKGIKKGRIAPA
jgi:hypothetical protein